jgi:putative hydrolase of the HAD superfamily
MTEELDAILFDAGGTLIEAIPPRETVFSEVLSRHGKKVGSERIAPLLAKADGVFDSEFAKHDGKNEGTLWAKYDDFILDELGFRGDRGDLAKDLSAAWDEIMPKVESWVSYPEAVSVLEILKEREFKLGVVSNATDLVRRVFDNLGLTKYFDFLVISDEVGVRKPSPKIFHLAMEMAGTSPGRSLFVGDKLATDVAGAKRVGMNAVLVDRVNAFPDATCLRERDLNFFRRFA